MSERSFSYQSNFFLPFLFLSFMIHMAIGQWQDRPKSSAQYAVQRAPNSIAVKIIRVRPEEKAIRHPKQLQKVLTAEPSRQNSPTPKVEQKQTEQPHLPVTKPVPEPLPEPKDRPVQPRRESFGAVDKAKPLVHINAAPVYPRLAKRRGWEGTVVLRVRVRAGGTPASVEIQNSSGHAVLDRAAVRTVERWRFEPARTASGPIASWVTIPVEFRLVR